MIAPTIAVCTASRLFSPGTTSSARVAAILFRSMRDGWDLTDTRLYTVPIEGGLPTPLPMPVSGGGDISPDGQRAVYGHPGIQECR